jgi:hypothetical protein
MYMYVFIYVFCYKYSVNFLFNFVLFKYIDHRIVEGNNPLPHIKSRKQIQQVIKLKFLTLYNVIELTYDCSNWRSLFKIFHLCHNQEKRRKEERRKEKKRKEKKRKEKKRKA